MSLPIHRCGTRTIVASKIADDLQPAMVLWCPRCDDIALPDDNTPPRGIDFSDLTGEDLVDQLTLLSGGNPDDET